MTSDARREEISPRDPRIILAGIKQFGLASDGSDLRDLESAILALESAEIERLTAELAKSCTDGRFEDIDAGCIRAIEAEARAEAAERALTTWQPIETRPESDKPCWIGDPISQTMLVAYPGKRMPKGVWYILWSDRMVPWSPKIWMPLPAPPAALPKHEAEHE